MDVGTTRLAIIILGIACGIGLVGSIWLALLHIETPQILVAVISSTSAGIVGILVKTKDSGSSGPSPDFTKNPPLP